MSLFQLNTLTRLSPHFDEQQWIKQIQQTLDEELEEEAEIPVTIFGVPKPRMIADPDSYIPQQVAIGPYHHLRSELYDMERYKVAAAKRTQRELQHVKLQEVVDRLIRHELRIRANYHRPLGVGCEALAWMMAVDASFLLEFFQVCGVKKGKVLTEAPSRLAQLIDLSGNKTAYIAILRDITMLENQIPLFVVRMLLEFQFSSSDLAGGVLLDMVLEFSKELSPFKMAESSHRIGLKDRAHLLDFLYHFIVQKSEAKSDEAIEIHEEHGEEKEDKENKDSVSESHLRRLLHEIWKILSRLKRKPVQWIKGIIFSKPIKVIVRLPWTILSKIPIIRTFKEPIQSMFSFFHTDKDKKDEDEGSSSDNIHKPPLLEDITIPSITQLFEVGIQFLPTNQGITGVSFDRKTLTFSMPTMVLDVNSEVVLRNLIAYEACTAPGPLFLTRYTELMNGMIDTEMDVKILCRSGIIVDHLKSEKEVADLWNGMSKSIKLTKVPSLDKLIADVNKYYNGRLKVKFEKFMGKYVFGSWRILTFLSAIMLLLLTCLQAFCQVYSCGRIFRIRGLEPSDQ